MYFKTACLLICLITVSISLAAQDTALARLYTEIGFKKQLKKDTNGALESYNNALQQDSNYIEAYEKRAFIYSVLKEPAKKIADLSKLIKLQPKAIRYTNRARAFQEEGNYKAAINDMDNAIRMDKDSYYYSVRGDLYKDTKKYKSAVSDYKQAVALKKNPYNYQLVANIYMTLKNNSEALPYLDSAIALLPKERNEYDFASDEDVYFLKGKILYEQKKYNDALTNFNAYVNAHGFLSAYIADGYRYRGLVNCVLGNKEKAIIDFGLYKNFGGKEKAGCE